MSTCDAFTYSSPPPPPLHSPYYPLAPPAVSVFGSVQRLPSRVTSYRWTDRLRHSHPNCTPDPPSHISPQLYPPSHISPHLYLPGLHLTSHPKLYPRPSVACLGSVCSRHDRDRSVCVPKVQIASPLLLLTDPGGGPLPIRYSWGSVTVGNAKHTRERARGGSRSILGRSQQGSEAVR